VQALLLAALLAAQPAGATAVDDSLPTWSPDGKHIAFVRSKRRGTSVFVVRPNGRGLRRIASSSFATPTWSPDGKSLAIVRPRRGGRTEIVVARIATRTVRRVGVG
jgi:Tol biopolymer transport system component